MNKLMQKLIKSSPTKHVSILSESVMFKDKDTVQLETPILNVAFSGSFDGGLSSGLTLLAGKSKSFKSLLSLYAAKAYLKKYEDAVCILYDSEGGITPEYLVAMGIDPARVLHVPIEHLEMLKFDMVKQLKEIERGDKVIFIIDSIGNTASLKELDDALNEKSVAEMQRAKNIKAFFRMVTPSLVVKDIPCMAICHTYETMDLYPKQIISGGSGLIYSANQAFIISKSQEKDGTDVVGWNFTLNVEKSRFVKEKSKIPFCVNYDKGINKYSGILDLALESGDVVKPKVGWYSLVDPETGEIGEKSFRAKDFDTEQLAGKILQREGFKKFVENKYKLGSALRDSEQAEQDVDTDANEYMNED